MGTFWLHLAAALQNTALMGDRDGGDWHLLTQSGLHNLFVLHLQQEPGRQAERQRQELGLRQDLIGVRLPEGTRIACQCIQQRQRLTRTSKFACHFLAQ